MKEMSALLALMREAVGVHREDSRKNYKTTSDGKIRS
jgi:hypothetical protein